MKNCLPWNRREFLRTMVVSSGALAVTSRTGALAGAELTEWKNQIGLELFTVRDLLRKDYEGTLAKLAQIGYKEVEPADPYNNLEPKAYKALLDRYGLKMVSTHSGAADGPNLEKQLEGFQFMGIKYTEIRGGGRGGRGPRERGGPNPPAGGPGEPRPGGTASSQGAAVAPAQTGEPNGGQGGPRRGGEPGRGPGQPRPRQTVESVKASCQQLNKYGATAKKFGMKILIHNHAGEFDLLDDGKTTQYDIFLAETDPELVTMQLDIGWAYIAGQNAIEMFKKNPGRYELWHVKDAKYKEIDPKLTPSQRQRVGQIVTMSEGDIDYKAVFANASLAGLKHFVIEQDTAGQGGRDAVEDCRIAYDNLKKLLS